MIALVCIVFMVQAKIHIAFFQMHIAFFVKLSVANIPYLHIWGS